ncbi:hypothetical protein [Leadbetterella sp. DM7]|uniref:hypothetical protein n=1 Tax=Leadbetterella sp. DM7 TaxID=3235085 RepID=UPI00349E5758
MKIRILFIFLMLGSLPALRAQDSLAVPGRFGLSLNLGTLPGLELNYAFKPRLTARLSYSYLQYKPDFLLTVSEQKLNMNGAVKMSVPALSLVFTPSGIFKIVGGAAYITRGKADLLFRATENYEVNGEIYTPDEVGEINYIMDYSGTVAPFAALGLGRTVPKRRIGVGVELGSFFMASPKITLTGTERLVSMSEEASTIENNTKDWKYWPIVNLKINVRLD